MICTTIQNKRFDAIEEILPECEMVELRLDRCELTLIDIAALVTTGIPVVATCRIAEMAAKHPDWSRYKVMRECEERLKMALTAGASFVDVEIEAPRDFQKEMCSFAQEGGALFILSYHDFKGTKDLGYLWDLTKKMYRNGANIAKIVTTAHSQEDVDTVMSLYDNFIATDLIAFCMGEVGKQSRIECLRRGALYSYAAVSEAEAAAPGQWDMHEMYKAVYGDKKPISFKDIHMPASKSFAQRAIICAALAQGTSHLSGYTPCDDSEGAIEVAKALGAKVSKKDATLTIEGIGASVGSVDVNEIFVGESGLLTRLMIPIAAQISASDVSINGHKTLLNRPLKGANEMLSHFGVYLTNEKVPLKISGTLSGGRAEISGKDGSQLISGLVMALALGKKASTIEVTEPKSIPYLFITAEVMQKFGVKVKVEMVGERDFVESGFSDLSLCTGLTFKVAANQAYKAADIDLEGDWSAAANLFVAAGIFGKGTFWGLDDKSSQADITIQDVLVDAGAMVMGDKENGYEIRKSPLLPFNVDTTNCPDLFPILSILAAFCQGTSRIQGLERLVTKESNRAEAIKNMLTQLGVEWGVEDENDLMVYGQSLAQRCLSGTLLKGGSYTSHHDHRMVMALKVAELGADGPIVIDDEACVAKSFPDFLNIWNKRYE